jgi:hypothetical protein
MTSTERYLVFGVMVTNGLIFLFLIFRSIRQRQRMDALESVITESRTSTASRDKYGRRIETAGSVDDYLDDYLGEDVG